MKMSTVIRTVAVIAIVALLASLSPGCASPKSDTALSQKETRIDGFSNSSRVDVGGNTAQNSGSTPTSTTHVMGANDKPRIVGAAPGPVDAFGLDALNMTMGLSNTVKVTKGKFDFGIVEQPDGTVESTITGVTFDEFSTSPPETINALAGFQREFNPAKIAEVEATKEAWNKAVEEWAKTVRETVPALADQILKTFIVK